ncbi:phosphoribosylformylglycinamidine synthase subunit PurQ [Longirhabdus pacifica]|uniref:phosphoribosylformylglycinamidine synthase subunit PurQ n=1 Tax=Longirhabdus pacifica TaxID=2305227 RepID=UPI001008A7B1|nr:phosphoribosylformylglycinamidine synthase subunit PurQ [Longirhabdus pacifica]
MHVAVLVFPGSNCDVDCYKAVEQTMEQPVSYVWHDKDDLTAYDGIIIPGGFSYGDYLRSGSIARFAPVMSALVKAAEEGKWILGICNGFQILLEAGLLPGAMLKNENLKFQCFQSTLTVENNQTVFTSDYEHQEKITIPIAHGEGNYYCDPQTLAQLEQHNQIVFRYADHNPNGSVDHIAGICNKQGNVLGMMPHPERAIHDWLGSADGRRMFTSILKAWREHHDTVINS